MTVAKDWRDGESSLSLREAGVGRVLAAIMKEYKERMKVMCGGSTAKMKKMDHHFFIGCGMSISALAMTDIAYPGIDIAPCFQ